MGQGYTIGIFFSVVSVVTRNKNTAHIIEIVERSNIINNFFFIDIAPFLNNLFFTNTNQNFQNQLNNA